MILKVSHRDDDEKIRNYICMETKIGLTTFYPLDNIFNWWLYQFEVMGKSWISNDFGYFIEYMNSPDCELVMDLEPEEMRWQGFDISNQISMLKEAK